MRDVAGIPMLSMHEPTLSPWARAFKRFIDVFGAALGLVLLSPFLLLIALAIRLDSQGPALFRQNRVGRHGREFKLVKFRSMVRNAEEMKRDVSHLNEAQGAMFKIREDPRVTRTGQFLRRTSLDELPQLWNVLRGDMSLVGPRPALAGGGGGVRRLASPTAGNRAWDHRSVAGQRSQRLALRRDGAAGHLLRRELVGVS